MEITGPLRSRRSPAHPPRGDGEDPSTAQPARPTMTYDDWMAAAAEEYRRTVELLRDLAPDDWSRPTDCTEWDVRALVCHVIGIAEAAASMRESARQAWRGRRSGVQGAVVDKMNAVQVAERVDASPALLLEQLDGVVPRALAARRRVPGPLRSVKVPWGPPLGTQPLGYLTGRIYTRDVWMHRFDICRATGRAPLLTEDHDGRLVDDVVEEWSRLHGASYRLRLTGPAGGTWGSVDQEPLELDAVEFVRAVAGRDRRQGLLATQVPF